jgi:Flp pilus assembly protein TadG
MDMQHISGKLYPAWRAFRSDRRGNVAVIFAMVPLLYLAVRGLTT